MAILRYADKMAANGSDPYVGRKLGALLRSCNFNVIETTAIYEIYEDSGLIAEYLALQLDDYDSPAAEAFRAWRTAPDALFAQAWFEVVGRLNDTG